jgi:uncharacterized membrane protein YeaQ/YmgE (transglycosylase-associated protein family)
MLGVESVVALLIVGALAGWAAGKIVRGYGFGLLGNIVIGIVGAFIGVWLLSHLGVQVGRGFIAATVQAIIGAVILLVIVGFFRR